LLIAIYPPYLFYYTTIFISLYNDIIKEMAGLLRPAKGRIRFGDVDADVFAITRERRPYRHSVPFLGIPQAPAELRATLRSEVEHGCGELCALEVLEGQPASVDNHRRLHAPDCGNLLGNIATIEPVPIVHQLRQLGTGFTKPRASLLWAWEHHIDTVTTGY